jgi:glycosyltransferase involved in cell wall biosynthesis
MSNLQLRQGEFDIHLGLREFSIVIPVHRDWNRAEETVTELVEFLSRRTQGRPFQIILVVDETDGAIDQLTSTPLGRDPRVSILATPDSIGKGDAIKLGVSVCGSGAIAIADADGSAHPEEVFRLLCLTDRADAVVGSRWLDGSSINRPQPWRRRLASRGFNGLVRLFLKVPVRDTQCGYKAFKADRLREVLPEVAVGDYGFDVDVLLKFRRRGYEIYEAPISWGHKDGSKVRLLEVVPMLGLTLVAIWVANSKLGGRIGITRLARVYHRITSLPHAGRHSISQ